jgi:magnesium transporter
VRTEQFLALEFTLAHPLEAADLLAKLSTEDRLQFFEENPPELAARLFQLMDPSTVADDLENTSDARASGIISQLPLEIASVLLRRLKEEKRSTILTGLPDPFKEKLSILLRFPENSAGALMDPQVLTFFQDSTVKEAVDQISTRPKYVLFYVPVVDRQQKLAGVVSIQELMLAPPTASLKSILEAGVPVLSPSSDFDTITSHPGWKIYHDLPVVDRNDVFLGVLTHRVLRQLAAEREPSGHSAHLIDAGKALGELYWLGISALAKGASSLVGSDRNKKGS